MINYKGYIGQVEYDDEQHIFAGSVINTKDVITFQGETVQELEKAFRDSVDDYLTWCKEDGVEPEKPYSGRFNVRFDPSVHQRAAIAAKKQGDYLNRFVDKSVEDLRDYNLAVERLAASEGKPTVPFSEHLKKDGISQADLDAMENVEFE